MLLFVIAQKGDGLVFRHDFVMLLFVVAHKCNGLLFDLIL